MATFTKYSHLTDDEFIGMRYTGTALDPDFVEEAVGRLESRNEELAKVLNTTVEIDGDVIAVSQVS